MNRFTDNRELLLAVETAALYAQLKTAERVIHKIQKDNTLNSRPIRRLLRTTIHRLEADPAFVEQAKELMARVAALSKVHRKRRPKPISSPTVEITVENVPSEVSVAPQASPILVAAAPSPASPTSPQLEPPRLPPTEQEWTRSTEVAGRISWKCVKCGRHTLVGRNGICRDCAPVATVTLRIPPAVELPPPTKSTTGPSASEAAEIARRASELADRRGIESRPVSHLTLAEQQKLLGL